LFHDLPMAHKITVNQTGAFYFSQACSEDVVNFFQKQTNDSHHFISELTMDLQWTYNGDTGAFNSDNIGAEDVKLFLLKQFLLKQTCKLFRFLSETMDTFSLAGSVQQAQKSTHPAEGLNPL